MAFSSSRRQARRLIRLTAVSVASDPGAAPRAKWSASLTGGEAEGALASTDSDSPVSAGTDEWSTLHEVSVDIHENQMHAFLTEGASPILRVLARLVMPDSGKIQWSGTLLGWRRMRPIGFIPRGASITSQQLVRDDLLVTLAASALTLTTEEFDQVVHDFELRDILDVPVCELSAEVEYRLMMARSALLGVRVFLVDEPTLGMVSQEAETLLSQFRRIVNRGYTLVLQTRSPEVAASCDEVFLLVAGRIRGDLLRPDVAMLRMEYAAAMGTGDSSRGTALGRRRSYEAPRASNTEGVPVSGWDVSGGDVLPDSAGEGLLGDGEDSADESAPLWVPTRQGGHLPMTPLPDAALPTSPRASVRATASDYAADADGAEPELRGSDDLELQEGGLVVEDLDDEPLVEAPTTSALPLLPRQRREVLDLDSEMVIAQAQGILNELPGSIVPDEDDEPSE